MGRGGRGGFRDIRIEETLFINNTVMVSYFSTSYMSCSITEFSHAEFSQDLKRVFHIKNEVRIVKDCFKIYTPPTF